jgi:hypothetical protein
MPCPCRAQRTQATALHRASRSVPGGVDHQIDPGIGGHPRTIDTYLEQLILHQQLPGGADVLSAHVWRLALNAAAIPALRSRAERRIVMRRVGGSFAGAAPLAAVALRPR